MRMTVLGASGQVGRHIVSMAAADGHTVRAVWRRAPDIEIAGAVEVAVEPALDAAAVARVVDRADVVVSAVGQRRTHPRIPWSRILSPIDLCEQLTTSVLAATDAPVACVSAGGVGDSRSVLSPLLRWLFDHSNIGVAYADLGRMETLLADDGRPCVCVRPTTLTHRREERSRVVRAYRLFSVISRRAVARFTLDAATGLLETRGPRFAAPLVSR